ncbi:MAG: hypothetical protein ABEI80_00260 [Haloplanus sp.]
MPERVTHSQPYRLGRTERPTCPVSPRHASLETRDPTHPGEVN